MTANYAVLLRNAAGDELELIDDFTSLDYTRSLNAIGSLTMTLPDRYQSTLFGPDYRLEIWRTPLGGSPYYEMNTFWLIRNISQTYTPDGNALILEAVDLMDILKRRLVAYTRDTDQATKIVERGTEDYADNLMRDFVREAMGPGATDSYSGTDRAITGLTVEPNLTIGYGPANTEQESSFIPVIDALSTLAEYSESQGTKLYFNMSGRPISGTDIAFYVTKDHLGANRSISGAAPVVFSWEFGNLSEITLALNYIDSRSAMYVLGPGTSSGRTVRLVDGLYTDYSPFARIEEAVSFTGRGEAKPSVINTLMDNLGEAEVYRVAPKATVTAVVNDQIGYVYGYDYQFGDLVTVMSENRRFDCAVRSVGVSVDGNGEAVDIVLEGEEVI
jgi:hypothetical protein